MYMDKIFIFVKKLVTDWNSNWDNDHSAVYDSDKNEDFWNYY